MRKFFLIIEKGAPLGHQLTWSHYRQLLSIKDINEINYYIEQIEIYHWGKRTLQDKIKSHEYQRLSDEMKNKLINKEEIDVSSYIKNPIFINTFNSDKENISENTFYKKVSQWLTNL